MEQVPDRIEKRVLLHAPRSRVWAAVSDAREFGDWFGAKFDSPFAAGTRVHGRIAPTKADPEVAKLQEPHVGIPFDIDIDRIEPERLFSFRWHPYGVDPKADLAREQMTLVEFTLEEAPEGTWLTVTESGFSRLPPERRAEAYAANEGGWTHQGKVITKYLAARAH